MQISRGFALLLLALFIVTGVAFATVLISGVPGEGVVVAASAPASTPILDGNVLTLDVPASLGIHEYTVLTYTVDHDASGYILVDVDGDAFRCNPLPAMLSDMETCEHWRRQ
jgi:hypothetical protein